MIAVFVLALLGQPAQTEWALPTRGFEGRTHDVVQRIDDVPRSIVCYVAREAADKGIAISCLHSREGDYRPK